MNTPIVEGVPGLENRQLTDEPKMLYQNDRETNAPCPKCKNKLRQHTEKWEDGLTYTEFYCIHCDHVEVVE